MLKLEASNLTIVQLSHVSPLVTSRQNWSKAKICSGAKNHHFMTG